MSKSGRTGISGGVLVMGATELAQAILQRIDTLGIKIAGVISTKPTFKIAYSPNGVKNYRHADMQPWCQEHEVPFTYYASLDDLERFIQATHPDLALLAGWYHLVPSRIRAMVPKGCIGVHASLLPKYRGNAPLNWAMLNGDSESGVSLFGLSDEVDDGPLYGQKQFQIGPDDYISDVIDKAEQCALELIGENLKDILDGTGRIQQQSGCPTYSLQRQPEDGAISWARPAEEIRRLIRAVSRPYPGAFGYLSDSKIIIWKARVAHGAPQVFGAPGQVIHLPDIPFPCVVTGKGLLALEEIESEAGLVLSDLRKFNQQRFK
jgi:methionyl-tRNA formyltransferase